MYVHNFKPVKQVSLVLKTEALSPTHRDFLYKIAVPIWPSNQDIVGNVNCTSSSAIKITCKLDRKPNSVGNTRAPVYKQCHDYCKVSKHLEQNL